MSFTSLGCNMLKCYKHKKNCRQPTLINRSIYACGKACGAIYKEFNDYLREKFNIVKDKESDKCDDFPIETLSIYDKVKNENFCGLQLSAFKTFSILPAASWWNKEDISVEEYVDKYKKSNPLQLRNLAGLVDSPPLTWDTAKQNACFNIPYCDRFQKEYSRVRDECDLRFHRKGLSYLFGHNFVNMFPDLDDIIKNGSIPLEHLKDYILGNGLNVNEAYVEKPSSQSDLERYLCVENPDIITENSRVIGTNSSPTASSSAFLKKRAAAVNVFAEIVEEISKEIGIELSVTTLPNISARLLKHYSSKFLERALVVSHSSSLPVSICLFSLTARLVINELTIKLAARLLTFVASSANILFTITMITVIPDIVLSYYNIGGLNNELTRKTTR